MTGLTLRNGLADGLLVTGTSLVTTGVTGTPAVGYSVGVGGTAMLLYWRYRQARREGDDPSTDGVETTEEVSA